MGILYLIKKYFDLTFFFKNLVLLKLTMWTDLLQRQNTSLIDNTMKTVEW